MYTAADVNLTSPDYYNRSIHKDNETSDMEDDPKSRLNKMVFTLYGIVSTLGTIGNGLVIWIAGFRMKKTITVVWFLNLAIADFLCCASLPLRIADWVIHFSHFPDPFCMLSIILFNLNVSASVLLLVAMSIDRCVSVMWPFWSKIHRTRKVVRITAAIIWVMSLLLTGLLFYLYKTYSDDVNEWCVYNKQSNEYLRKIKENIRLFRFVTFFVIPFLIILISYIIIFVKIRNCKRQQRSQRTYRIITAVILGFFICWLPYYIWPLTPIYDANKTVFYVVNITVTMLAYLNSCINPVIYVFMSQNFKQGLFTTNCSKLERSLSEPPSDLS